MLSLVIFQAAILLAIRALAEAVHRSANAVRTPIASPQSAAAPTERLVLELQHAVQSLLKAGRSYAHIAEQTGVGKAHLSLLMNHFDRAKRGDRVLGVAALRGIKAKLRSARWWYAKNRSGGEPKGSGKSASEPKSAHAVAFTGGGVDVV